MHFPRKYLLLYFLVAFSAAMAVLSPGFFEADEITHYLKARAIFHDWRAVLDIWGRPACSGLFGLASLAGGLIAARLLAVVITALTAVGTVKLWESLAIPDSQTSHFRPPTMLVLLLYAQPLFLMNTFAVMTELPLACCWVWAAVFLARRKPILAGLILGLGGLARPEGWFAIALWPVMLWLWQRWCGHPARSASEVPPAAQRRESVAFLVVSTLCALIPVLAWYLAGLIAFHNPLWPRDQFPWHAASQYGTTGLFFLDSALISLAIWMWFPIFLTLKAQFRSFAAAGFKSPILLLVATPFLCFYALHAFLGIFGLMGSMSLPRYFVAVAPFAAILALLGLRQLESGLRRPRLVRRGVLVLAILPLAVLVAFRQLPTSKTTDMHRLDVALDAFRQRVPPDEWSTRLIAGHPYIFFVLGIPLDTPAHLRVFDAAAIARAPAGTMLITDSKIWRYENRPTPEELRAMGYAPDPLVVRAIDAVPARIDLSTLGPTSNPVALWIKQPNSPADNAVPQSPSTAK